MSITIILKPNVSNDIVRIHFYIKIFQLTTSLKFTLISISKVNAITREYNAHHIYCTYYYVTLNIIR